MRLLGGSVNELKEFKIKVAEEKNNNDWINNGHDMCRCNACGWQGPIAVCDNYEDYESWEMSHIHWTVICCPVCAMWKSDGLIEETWSSILECMDNAEIEVRSLMKELEL